MEFTQYNKLWAACVMSILALVELHFGWSFGLSEEIVLSIIAIITPLLVWLIPNRA